MPIWLSLPLAFLINHVIGKLTEAYQFVIQVLFTIADRMSDCSFSLFIISDSNVTELKKRILEQYKAWITLSIFASNPIAFIIFNYPVIKNDDITRQFFESNEYLAKLWQKVDTAMQQNQTTTSLEEFLKSLLSKSFFSFLLNIFDMLLIEPFRMTEELNRQIYSILNQNPSDEVTAIQNYLSSILQKEESEIKPITVEDELLRFNPFLHLISPTILSHIRMYWAYSIIEQSPRLITPPDEYLRNLFADLYVDNEHIASILPDEQLIISYSMAPKQEWLQPSRHEVVLNYAGITRKETFAIIPPLELKVTARGRTGASVCNVQGDIPVGIDPQDWNGEFWINCNTFWGSSYSLAWIEFEHNYGSTPLWVSVRAGTYKEACYGTSYILVGYREGDRLYLSVVGTVPYTMLNPWWITLYGSFPSPRFVVGIYHTCYSYPLSVTGARITGIKYGWSL